MKKFDKISVVVFMLIFLIGCNKNTFTFNEIDKPLRIEMPIDTPKEAIEYSKNIDWFTQLRDNFEETKYWIISAKYETEKEHKELFESWYKSGKIDKKEYEGRIRWSEKEGDYWDVLWKHRLLSCGIQFRNDGKLKNITGLGLGDKPYSCEYGGK